MDSTAGLSGKFDEMGIVNEGTETDGTEAGKIPIIPQKNMKRFVGRKRAESAKSGSSCETSIASSDLVGVSSSSRNKSRVIQAIPADILENDDLNKDLNALPSHYNFEIHKTASISQHFCAANRSCRAYILIRS